MRGTGVALLTAALATGACSDQAAKRPDPAAHTQITIAQAQIAVGQLDGALESYDRAVAEAPDYGPTYYLRGLVWRYKGELDRAIADFSQAVALGMDRSAFAYTARGEAQAAGGRYAPAIADYDLALARRPGFAAAQAGRGAALAATGEDAAALPDLDRALAQGPGVVVENLSVVRTTVISRIGPPGYNTETTFLRFSTHSYIALAYAARGGIRVRRGDYQGAIADLDAAIDLRPDPPESHVQRGLAHLALGRCAEGRADLQTAAARGGAALLERQRAFIAKTPCAGQVI